MRLSKKTAVMLLAVAMLSAGSSTAMAQRNGGGGDGGGGGGGGGGDGGGREKVTICHRTHSDRNPWRKITISENALDAHERHGDTFPDADGDCPGRDIPDDGDGNGNGGGGHDGDGHDHDGDGHDHDGDFEASCSVSQDNGSDNSTGDAAQSGLINVNNIALQGLNLDILGNLLCRGNFLNDLTAGILGTAIGGSDRDHDGNGHDGDGDTSCSVSQDNGSDNSTGDAAQSGLINVNNIALQGLNLDILGNLLCQGNFLNDLTAGILGTAIGGSDGDDHGDHHGFRARSAGRGGLLAGLFGGDSVLSSLGVLF